MLIPAHHPSRSEYGSYPVTDDGAKWRGLTT